MDLPIGASRGHFGGQRVVILDDLLATGGTMAAGIGLLRQAVAFSLCGAVLLGFAFNRCGNKCTLTTLRTEFFFLKPAKAK